MNKEHRPSSSERIAQTWRELNSLTLDNLGVAPRWLKVLLLALCVLFIGVFGWMLLIKPIKLEHNALMTQEQTLISQYAQKYAKAQQLSAIENQTQILNRDLATIIEVLPTTLNMGLIVEQLHAAAMRIGVKIVDVKVQSEVESELFFERGLTITVEGGYHEMGRLLSQLSSLSVALTFHDFDIEKLFQNSNQTKLRMTLHAKAYRAKVINVTKEVASD
ncbi:hypothetical protein AAX09_06840 [Moraxella bovoculi]|uniref:type 4a pilus biogenesis protein PilO n=1 Tax=Moraxella bovoculi TaxID=386891 RepID=UPI000624EE61|nr:type 4a pilus biogenesis protein PilO [Moraxella bovoculi]AKG19128.1 hypothetical protein AAX09_06840 [Moraxella bovoculi]NSM11530.1 type 4a pilus biogenesis protein PilO [Moraxella bovoculi]